jgi:hypothetical protein
VPANSHDFKDCWYFNVDGGSFSDNPSIESETSWSSAVDPGGVYGADPQLEDDPADPEGIPGGSIRMLVKPLVRHAEIGVNGRLYSGHYGPYQYGPPAP